MKKEIVLRKLGAKIRNIREQSGMTQKVFANSINKEPQSIQRIEAGKVNPSIFYLIELCRGLNITIDELLKDIDSN